MAKAEKLDHRIRVARERRVRMKARLFQSVMKCYATHLKSGPPTVEEVIADADVSRATFYKYFNSVEQAIEQRAVELSQEMVESLEQLVTADMSPDLRFTMSIHLTMLRSALDPTWAAFVGSTNMRGSDQAPPAGMINDLSGAADAGKLNYVNLAAACSLALGAMREAVWTLSRMDEPDREYVEEVTCMILMAFGMDRTAAKKLVEEATIFIRGIAPDRLGWWRDPWVADFQRPPRAALPT